MANVVDQWIGEMMNILIGFAYVIDFKNNLIFDRYKKSSLWRRAFFQQFGGSILRHPKLVLILAA